MKAEDLDRWFQDAAHEGIDVDGLADYVREHPDHVCYCDGCGLPSVHGRLAETFPTIDPGAEITLTRDGEEFCDGCREEGEESMGDYGLEDEAAEYDYYGHGCSNYDFDW